MIDQTTGDVITYFLIVPSLVGYVIINVLAIFYGITANMALKFHRKFATVETHLMQTRVRRRLIAAMVTEMISVGFLLAMVSFDSTTLYHWMNGGVFLILVIAAYILWIPWLRRVHAEFEKAEAAAS